MANSLHAMNQGLRHTPHHSYVQSLLHDAYDDHSVQFVERAVRPFSDQLHHDPGSAWSVLQPILSPATVIPRVAGNTQKERIAAFHSHFTKLFATPPPPPPLPNVKLPHGLRFCTSAFYIKDYARAISSVGNVK